MESAMIHIKCMSAWGDILRAYQIFLDGKPVGTIREGMSRTFEVHPGHYDLFLTIDWCSSRRMSIDLAPGERVKFICQARNPLFVFYNITFGSRDYIKLFYEGQM